MGCAVTSIVSGLQPLTRCSNLKQWTKLLVSLAATAALAACGGGGGDDDSSGGAGGGGAGAGGGAAVAADKYVGTWVMGCISYDPGESEKETAVVTKTADNRLAVQFALTSYTNETCAGAGTLENFTGQVVIDAQTTATYGGNSEPFDQVTATIVNEGTFKWLTTVRANGTQLVIDFEDNGNESSTVYPTNPNEGQSVYTKQ
jgi:hypothetical protein